MRKGRRGTIVAIVGTWLSRHQKCVLITSAPLASSALLKAGEGSEAAPGNPGGRRFPR